MNNIPRMLIRSIYYIHFRIEIKTEIIIISKVNVGVAINQTKSSELKYIAQIYYHHVN